MASLYSNFSDGVFVSGIAPTADSTEYLLPVAINANSSSVLTKDEVLQMKNRDQFQILLPSFIMTCVLLVLGIPGNLLAVVVYLTKMKRNTAAYFIMTLAISDLINCAISLPVEMHLITNFWTFDIPWLCKFSRYISAAMNNTSSFILAAIAVERFRSICTPMKPRLTNLTSKIFSASLMAIAILSALPMLWGYGTFTVPLAALNHTGVIYGKTCLVDDGVINTSYPHFLLIYFFAGHLVVFLILVILYICIGSKLLCGSQFSSNNRFSQSVLLQRQNSTFSTISFSARSGSLRTPVSDSENPLMIKRSISRSSSNSKTNIDLNLSRRHGGHAFRAKRLTCMLFLVTSVFEISFIPYLVIVAMRNSDPDMYLRLPIGGKMAYQLFLRSYLINCAMNPIIYCFYNQNFRHGVRRLFNSIKSAYTDNIKKNTHA